MIHDTVVRGTLVLNFQFQQENFSLQNSNDETFSKNGEQNRSPTRTKRPSVAVASSIQASTRVDTLDGHFSWWTGRTITGDGVDAYGFLKGAPRRSLNGHGYAELDHPGAP